jgi:hypothetical protein
MTIPSEHADNERALDALMAAAFRAEDPDRPVSEEEARRLVENPPALSPEDEEVLASMSPDYVQSLLRSARADGVAPRFEERQAAPDASIRDAYAAMNRGREGDELDDEARREIEKKRRELLGEPEAGAQSQGDEQDGS